MVSLAALAGCGGGQDPRQVGQRSLTEQNYADAAGAFRNAVRDEPRDYQSYYYLGQSYEKLGAPHQAAQAYKSGLDVMGVTERGRADAPFRVKLLDGLASAIARSGSARDAETDAVEQKARGSQSAECYFLLAKIARNRGDADAALDYYNRAALIDKSNFFVVKEYGLYAEQLPGAATHQRAEVPLRQAYVLNSADTQVQEALRRLGIVPGLSLKDRNDLAEPIIPKGPIPPVDWNKVRHGLGMGGGSGNEPRHASDNAAPTSEADAAASPGGYRPGAIPPPASPPTYPIAGSTTGTPKD